MLFQHAIVAVACGMLPFGASAAGFGDIKFESWAMLGSHDAATGYVDSKDESWLIFRLAQTQDVGFYDQAKCGARYFDLRCIITESGELKGHHGDVDGPYVGTPVPVSTMLDELVQFANENPSVEDLIVIGLYDWTDEAGNKNAEVKGKVVELLQSKGIKVVADGCKQALAGKTLQEVADFARLDPGKGSIIALAGDGDDGGFGDCSDGNDDGPTCCSLHTIVGIPDGITCCDGAISSTCGGCLDVKQQQKDAQCNYIKGVQRGNSLLNIGQFLWKNAATDIPAVPFWELMDGRCIISENTASGLNDWSAQQIADGCFSDRVGSHVNVVLADNVCKGGADIREALLDNVCKGCLVEEVPSGTASSSALPSWLGLVLFTLSSCY